MPTVLKLAKRPPNIYTCPYCYCSHIIKGDPHCSNCGVSLAKHEFEDEPTSGKVYKITVEESDLDLEGFDRHGISFYQHVEYEVFVMGNYLGDVDRAYANKIVKNGVTVILTDVYFGAGNGPNGSYIIVANGNRTEREVEMISSYVAWQERWFE